jgi:erythromycin esterase
MDNLSYHLTTSADLDPLIENIGDAHCVMLGEASHGTHEYYTWRTAITKRLIEEKGFQFIAVEGDWPDCYRINRYIKGLDDKEKTAREVLAGFRRWPTWMWSNWEVDALVNWLKTRNDNLPLNQRAGFYGLDVYSLWESLEAMHKYLKEYDPANVGAVSEAIRCFEPYGKNEQVYARANYFSDDSCRQQVVDMLSQIRKQILEYDHDPEAALNMEQNAFITVNAEEYYSEMMGFGSSTWNLRDKHMLETLDRVRHFYGPESKCIVWAHNTHIGDARYTDMKASGMWNIGQLAREQWGETDTYLLGFGSYNGTVMAGQQWDAPMEEMQVPEARPGSMEEKLHEEIGRDALVIFDHGEEHAANIFYHRIPHRAIGVVYDPESERASNYVPSVLARRYDAFIYIDESRALHPLPEHTRSNEVPSTYPFAF